MTSYDNARAHQALCEEIHDLYVRKNQDYGDSFHQTWEEEGFAMARIRLSDKLSRFKQLSKGNPQLVENENIRDTLVDLANYAMMTVMEIDRMEDCELMTVSEPNNKTITLGSFCSELAAAKFLDTIEYEFYNNNLNVGQNYIGMRDIIDLNPSYADALADYIDIDFYDISSFKIVPSNECIGNWLVTCEIADKNRVASELIKNVITIERFEAEKDAEDALNRIKERFKEQNNFIHIQDIELIIPDMVIDYPYKYFGFNDISSFRIVRDDDGYYNLLCDYYD